jgi:predicted nuclease with TOPRIM domain
MLGEERIMREQMQARLEALKKEFEAGQAELNKVEERRLYLREMLLRIGGAIQVLEEMLAQGQDVEQRNGIVPDEAQSETNKVSTVRTSPADTDQGT